MKKILLLFAIGYSLLAIFPSPLFALGQPCCNSSEVLVEISYDPDRDQCRLASLGGLTPTISYADTNCTGGEYCNPFTITCISAREASDISLPGAPPICGDAANPGTPTALGCIPNNPAQAIPLILNWAVGIGTGLGFLLLLYGAFTLITAGPNPENVDKGKSIITSAVSGLLFIILSVVLLKIIGISILGL